MKFYLYMMGYYILTRGFGDLIRDKQYPIAIVVLFANLILIRNFSKTYNTDEKEEG